ncbi:hypothetical protein R3P38DRAFT_3274106 [Favolaschia claudopus]|uniref:Required for respiratory growth protein 7, mitochondrial n=1 Tax=Favolaschia claudopus TaxID=2862362 RepID=A0AAW0B199_9AGAR
MQARLCLRRGISSARTGVLSTTYQGTLFEERSMKILQDHLSMSLRRVGGKSDGGIDLMGWWWLPNPDSSSASKDELHRRRLRVLAQCKAEKRKPGPKYVREMEGVLHRHMLSLSTTTQYPLVALLVSESPFTKGTILRAQSSPVPFFLLHLPPVGPPSLGMSRESEQTGDSDTEPEADDQRIGSAVWNPALSRGLLGNMMEARWERAPTGVGRPGLWWAGQRLQSWVPDQPPDMELPEAGVLT